jgi:hypothetical protein
MSYGPNLTDINRRLAGYASRILNGKKPAELPVQQLVKVEPSHRRDRSAWLG